MGIGCNSIINQLLLLLLTREIHTHVHAEGNPETACNLLRPGTPLDHHTPKCGFAAPSMYGDDLDGTESLSHACVWEVPPWMEDVDPLTFQS